MSETKVSREGDTILCLVHVHFFLFLQSSFNFTSKVMLAALKNMADINNMELPSFAPFATATATEA
jgi:hypothetical protein